MTREQQSFLGLWENRFVFFAFFSLRWWGGRLVPPSAVGFVFSEIYKPVTLNVGWVIFVPCAACR